MAVVEDEVFSFSYLHICKRVNQRKNLLFCRRKKINFCMDALILLIRSVRLACQPTSKRYCSLILNQHQPPATSQLAVLFSHNKLAPTTSHSQANTAVLKKISIFAFIHPNSLFLK